MIAFSGILFTGTLDRVTLYGSVCQLYGHQRSLLVIGGVQKSQIGLDVLQFTLFVCEEPGQLVYIED